MHDGPGIGGDWHRLGGKNEAASSLAAQIAQRHLRAQGRKDVIARMAPHCRPQTFGRRQIDVRPDEVDQPQRPDPVPRRTQRRVDLARVTPFFQQRQRLAIERPGTAVDNETGAIGALDHRLARAFGQRARLRQRLRIGARIWDQFDQPHRRGGVEEMQAHHPVGPRQPRRNRRNRQGRRVAGQHRPGPQQRLERREHRLLGVQPLDHRLDNQIGRGQPLDPVHHRHPAQHRIPRLCRHRALVHARLQRCPQPRHRRRPRVGTGICRDHVLTCLRIDLRNPQPHRA